MSLTEEQQQLLNRVVSDPVKREALWALAGLLAIHEKGGPVDLHTEEGKALLEKHLRSALLREQRTAR